MRRNVKCVICEHTYSEEDVEEWRKLYAPYLEEPGYFICADCYDALSWGEADIDEVIEAIYEAGRREGLKQREDY